MQLHTQLCLTSKYACPTTTTNYYRVPRTARVCVCDISIVQACRHGLVQHLEHLLFYGADMDGRNASGNSPLHVCAVNNQEACARMLLFRGAQRGAQNFANQTPYQVFKKQNKKKN